MSTLQKTLWQRSLNHYPSNSQRVWYLALAVIATIIIYYESYVLPSVAPSIMGAFGLPLQGYVFSLLAGNLIGAVSAIFGSLSDRLGRANLVVYGLFITGIGTLAMSLTSSLWAFLILTWVLGFVEGVILIATPALVRDFSPRMGRATAMGFWTVGPVGGSVLATTVASQTLPIYHTWQSQYIFAGIIGMVIFVLCFFSVRELSPGIRDQIMNSLREKEFIEARANSIDVEAVSKHPWRQMLRPRLILSALGISTFLFIYYAAVSFFPTYLSNIFHFTLAQANGLVSIFWIVNVVAAILIGFISDRTLVRKPYMLGGAIATIVVTLLFISRIGVPTDGILMAIFLSLFGLTIATSYVTWMAGYTESVETINPALVATGLSVWGSLLRFIVAIYSLGFVFVVGSGSNASLWAIWWWICIAGMILFIPTILTLAGHWSPGRARTEMREKEHIIEVTA